MQELGASFEIYQGGHGLAVSTRARQQSHGYRINPAVRAKSNEGVDRSAFKSAIQTVTCFESKAARVMAMAVTRTHPTFFGDNNGNGFVDHFDFSDGFFLFLNQRSTRIGESLSVGFDFFDHQTT